MKMHWKIRHLLDHMYMDEGWDDHQIWLVPDGAIITAWLPSRGAHRFDERIIEQVEIHDDGSIIMVMRDDYDNPLSQDDLEGLKFSIYEAVITIGD